MTDAGLPRLPLEINLFASPVLYTLGVDDVLRLVLKSYFKNRPIRSGYHTRRVEQMKLLWDDVSVEISGTEYPFFLLKIY